MLTREHILQLDTLNNPWQKIAADVNLSGTISTLDLVHIRAYILDLTSSGLYPDDLWTYLHASRWLDNDFSPDFFDDPFEAMWNGTGYPDYLFDTISTTFLNSSGYPDDADHNDKTTWFYAIQMGDVTWDTSAIVNDSTFNPLDLSLAIDTTTQDAHGYNISSASLSMCTDRVEDEERITIHIGVTNKVDSLCAFQLGLSIDSTVLDLISFREGNLNGYDSAHHNMVDTAFRTVYVDVDTNTVTNLSAGDTLFSITLEATSTIDDISNYVTLEQNFLDNEIYLSSGTPGTISLSTLCSVDGSRGGYNPGNMQIIDKSDKIHLQIEDDISGMAYIEIFNVNGQRVKKAQKYFNAGRANIDKPNVPSGIYFINIYLNDQKEFFSQKMYLNGQ